MNFFNIYLEKIKKSTIKNKKKLDFKENQILNKIIVETPPENFDCDLSTNIALILDLVEYQKLIKIAFFFLLSLILNLLFSDIVSKIFSANKPEIIQLTGIIIITRKNQRKKIEK